MKQDLQYSVRGLVSLGAVAVAGMLAIALWAWITLPADQPLAIHWGVSGQPDGFAPKPVALLCVPLLMAFVTMMTVLRTERIDRVNQSGAALFGYVIWAGVLALMTLAQAAIVVTGMGIAVPVPKLIMTGCAMLLVIAGAGMARHPELSSYGKSGGPVKTLCSCCHCARCSAHMDGVTGKSESRNETTCPHASITSMRTDSGSLLAGSAARTVTGKKTGSSAWRWSCSRPAERRTKRGEVRTART